MLRTCCCERLKLRSTRSGRPCASRRSAALPDRRLTGRPTRAEGEMNDTDARLWHPWLRINRVLRVMRHTRWSGDGGPHHLKIGLAAGHDGSVLSCLGVQFHVAAYPQREEWREHVHSTGVRTQPGPLARRPNVTSIEARSPLFVVATANGGRMTWTFEPSDARMSTLPRLKSANSSLTAA